MSICGRAFMSIANRPCSLSLLSCVTHTPTYNLTDRCTCVQVIYSRNGVTITSTPVEHYTTGGPSALRVDWNGLSFVYSGDTHPTRTLNELAEGTDMLIQQIMGPLPAFDSLSFESQYLLNVSPPIPSALALSVMCCPG